MSPTSDCLRLVRLQTRHRALAPLILVVTGALAGCAANPSPEFVPLAWPGPPAPPRVQFVQLIEDSASLNPEIGTGFRAAFLEFVGGKAPPREHVYQPMDIDVSDDGQRVYIADYGQQVIFVADFAGQTVEPMRSPPLSQPFGVALDADENVYVSEQEAKRIIVVNRQGELVRAISDPSLIRPSGLAIDRDRNLLYVADASVQASFDHSVKVFDLEGELLRTLGEGKGSCDGCLMFPTFVSVGPEGRVFVSSTVGARVNVYDADGRYVTKIGERGNSFGMFDKPKGVAVDSFDNVYVVDSGWSNIQIFNQEGEVLLFFGGRGVIPGLLMNPTGIAIDRQNRIYVADFLNYRVAAYQLINTVAEDSFIELPELLPTQASPE